VEIYITRVEFFSSLYCLIVVLSHGIVILKHDWINNA